MAFALPSCDFLELGGWSRGAVAEREQYTNACSHLDRAIDQYLSPESANVLNAFINSDSHASLLGCLKRLEKPLANKFGAHADSGIGDLDHREATVAVDVHRNDTTVDRGIDRVLQQVADDVLEPVLMSQSHDRRRDCHMN